MKKVFIPAFYFPPHYHVRVTRLIKLCKWLPENGWQVIVLTVDGHYYDQSTVFERDDPELEKVAVYRIPFFDIYGSRFWIKIIFPLFIIFFALRHRKEYLAVLMSGSPFYPFALSFFLNNILGKPTILDFRDSWSINHGFDGRKKIGAFSHIEEFVIRWVEKISIKYASVVLFATSTLQREYEDIFPALKSKFYTVCNGYDPDDFTNIKSKRVSEQTTLVLAGQFNIYTPDAVDGLMESLQKLDDLHFLYIGNEHVFIKEKSGEFNVENQVTTLPLAPYQDVLPYIAGANIAMLTNGMVNGMGTKVFDYLALGKSVVALVPEHSIIAKTFGELPSVYISHPPHTMEKISDILEKIQNNNEPVAVDEEKIKPFTRPGAAQKIASLLKKLCDDSM